ncbi:MAG: MMPL family transporter [Candidatus Rokubacteria bacterium]|nr:MMPL family transporter [Candidatus Rokubacteria bacterium]
MTAVSRTGRLLRRLVRAACARPALTVLLAILLAVASVVYAFHALTFATSTRALLPQNKPYIERYVEYNREFGDFDDLIIVVEAPALPEAKLYAGRLVRELRTASAPFGRITYRIDPKQFEGRALLYLSKERLAEIREKVYDYQEFMETFAGRPTLDQLVEGLALQLANAFVISFLDLGLDDSKKSTNDLRFIEDLVAQVSARLDRVAPYRSPWGTLFSVNIDEASAGYFLSDDQRLLFILAEPKSRAGSFTSDREAIESDSEKATIIAFVLTLGLLLVAFLRFGKPIVMLLILTLGLCWSIGVATLAIGHLSLFSVMFISIVIGIGIDYGIYLLFRYEEEMFLGRSVQDALEITAARTGPGILLSAITAAGTFFVLMLTDFRGVQELGFIAGTAILFSWAAMMFVFPAGVVLVDRRRAGASGGAIPRAIALERVHVPIFERLAQYPRTVIVLGIAVTVLSAWGVHSVRFDYNLLNLQAEGTESVVWEKRILATAGRSGFAALSSANDFEELRRKHHAFARLGSVSEVDSALMLFPADQEEKQKIIRDMAPVVAPVRLSRPLPLDLDRLIAAFDTVRRRLAIATNETTDEDAKRRLARVTGDIERLLEKLRGTDRDISEPALTSLQQQVYRDFVRSFQRVQANLNPQKITLEDLPAEIRQKFVSPRGHFLLQIHPAVNIWDRDGAERFVGELRSVDPDVTGTPIITNEAIRLMERAYVQGTVYAILLVAGITFVTLRRIRLAALALLPLGLGLTWTAGLMYIFDLKFTLGNIFGLPLILGAAAEYGLNIVLRYIEGRDQAGPLVARSTVMAVLVSGLTTISGFGSLLIAHHRGVHGLGLLLTIGTIASLVASLIVLPPLLRMVQNRRDRRRARKAAATNPPTTGESVEAGR